MFSLKKKKKINDELLNLWNWIVEINKYPVIFDYKILKILAIFNIHNIQYNYWNNKIFRFLVYFIFLLSFEKFRKSKGNEIWAEFRDSEWRNKKVGRVIYMSGSEGEENKKRTKSGEGFIDCSFRLLPHFRPARYFNQNHSDKFFTAWIRVFKQCINLCSINFRKTRDTD